MEVSADGIFMCTKGDNCPNKNLHGNRKILLEAKSPFPSEDNPELVYYEIPPRHVPQLLAEMKVYDSNELWLVCSIQRSCTLISVTFDEVLWNSIWSLVIEFYEVEKPKMQTRVHPLNSDLCLRINTFIKQHSQLMFEVPTVTGEFGNVYLDPTFSSPFSPNLPRERVNLDLNLITTENKAISSEASSAFNACHEVLRTPAKELLVFMLTNKDRKQNKHIPYSYPIAYAMKGSSMTNADLQYMVSKLRDVLYSKKIPILAEAYDGQWHNHITQNSQGVHLTKMHGKFSWSHISKLSKDKCIEELSAHCIVKNEHKQTIPQLNCGFKKYVENNIQVMEDIDGQLTISTCSQKMSQIISVMQKSRPDLFKNGISVYQPSGIENITFPKRKKKNIQLGLLQNEWDILQLLVPESVPETDNSEGDEDFLPDLTPVNQNLENYLLSNNCPLLSNILTQLKIFNHDKWDGKSKEYLYTHVLTDGNELNRMCPLKELNIMATELRCFTGHLWYSANFLKAENVNVIVSAFGGIQLTRMDSFRKKEKLYQPDTLLILASCAVKNDSYPVEHLQIALGTVIQCQMNQDWYDNATCPLKIPILHEHKASLVKQMEFFSYPEMSASRKQLELRTFDFTHILMNMRNQILTRGFDFRCKEHFEELCKERPDILSIALVYDKIDTQNAFTAMKMFNYSVERWMKKKGYIVTAQFIRLVRNWHDVCNRRGLLADTRVWYLNNMHEFLTAGINFNAVPFQFAERYVRGMTWQTFEALLQNISTRIQLYYLSSNLTYNA